MKRSRYDAEYERIARRPPPKGPQLEFPDDAEPRENPQVVADRVAASHADFRERMAKLEAYDRQQAADRKVKADANAMRSNTLVMVQEYHRAGIDPPYTKPDGMPMYSLSFLLQMGWSIQQIGDTVTLIMPERFAHDAPSGRRDRPKPGAKTTPDGEASD